MLCAALIGFAAACEVSDAIEDGGQWRAVPRISGVFPLELINDAIDFVHNAGKWPAAEKG